MGQTSASHPDRRLDSWKEIAAFFGRDERTVRRWEKENVLPVHRVPGGAKGRVFAYESELRQWLSTPQAVDPAIPTRETPIIPIRPASRQSNLRAAAKWVAALALCVGLASAILVYRRAHRFAVQASAAPEASVRTGDLRRPTTAEAEDFYLKGRYYWNRRTPDDLNRAVDYFTQAIVKDPGYAEAYVGLADCYNLLREFGAMPPSEAYPRALSAAQRAVELDDTSAEAHNSLAFATFWWSWQGVTAEREFKRALELDPNLVRAHHWYATFLLAQHRFPEALDQMEQAQRLDPSSTAILADKGLLLWDSGRHNEGLTLLAQLETTEPSLSSTHDYLSDIYWRQKDYAKALMERKRSAELRHDEAGLAIASASEKGFAANGLRGLYESELPKLKDLVDRGSGDAYALAKTYAALGKRQEALRYLQISFDRREARMLVGDPIPELQADPAYQNFRAQVKQRLAQ